MLIKKKIYISLSIISALVLSSCGKKQEVSDSSEPAVSPSATATIETTDAPAGMYFSELTGMPISTSIEDQRPIAVMVDCESVAFPHYGLAEADVIYDLRNSMKNDYITRFMAIYKDYENIAQIGSVRSTRPTNVWLAGEWNAILCHDGGDSEAFELMEHDYAQQHLSGIFTRVDNGKSREFTEYVISGDVDMGINDYGYNKNYNEYKQEGNHFNFVKYNTVIDTKSFDSANSVILPNPHNGTTLAYNNETKTYDLSMYGELHKDAEDEQVLSFTNIILISCDYQEITNANIQYNIVDNSGTGYYLTDGKFEPITWKKSGENGITHYYDNKGNDLEMNRGKTYIGLICSDVWNDLSIQ